MARRLAAVFVLAFALAGCGGGGGGGGGKSSDQIALAADKTSKAGSMQADFTVSGAGVNGHGAGVFNTGQKGSGRLSITVDVGGRSFKIDTVITGTVLYMRSPAFKQLTGGKQWVKLDLGKIARQRGIDLGSLKGTARQSLKRLMQTSGVRKVPEDVWIDDKGFVRKVVYESTGSGTQKTRVTMVLHDFGPRVPIQPPPSGSVADIMNRVGG